VAKLPEPPDLLPARVQTAILDLGTPLCRIRRALVLLDLTGTWPTAAGASMAIITAPCVPVNQTAASIPNALHA